MLFREFIVRVMTEINAQLYSLVPQMFVYTLDHSCYTVMYNIIYILELLCESSQEVVYILVVGKKK